MVANVVLHCIGAALKRALGCLVDRKSRSIYLDGDIAEREFPRRRSGIVYYVGSDVTDADLLRRMRPGDIAHGPSPGVVSVIEVRTSSGSYTIARSGTWGEAGEDPAWWGRLQERWRACEAGGVEPQRTAAGTARRLLLATGRHSYGLRAQWRGLAHAAVHGGPAVVLSGGTHTGYQIDRVEAYAADMSGPLPVGGYRVCDWAALQRSGAGLVEATVDVPAIDGLPPLPRESEAGIQYATGRIRGCWTAEHLRYAVRDYGVRVVAAHQCGIAEGEESYLSPVIDRLRRLDKPVRKVLYTRLYGVLASRGGFVGSTEDKREMPSWRDDRVSATGPGRPCYAPDVAAAITGRNHVEVLRASIGRSVVAAHVDALWCDGPPEGREGWKVKYQGPIRVLACARVVSDVTATGTAEEGEEDELARDWIDGLGPSRSIAATSIPWHYAADDGQTLREVAETTIAHPDIRDGRWR